jgi:FKBP-type peptidyl-prolyl cis-trans isomerase 2
MVTVHYTLYEELLDSGSGSPSPSPSSAAGSSNNSGETSPSPSSPPLIVEDPDKKKRYQVLDSSREGDGRGEPLTFEVGAGDVFGNELFQAFDEVVRGRAAGETVRLVCPSPPAWDPELLFRVPGDHPEVERMRGRYKNVGGLAEGLVVELSNGKRAVVVAVSDEEITLDANDMLAGGSGGERVFELELVKVEQGKKKKEGEE